MKRLFLMIFALLLLTACGKQELPVVEEEILPVPTPTQTEAVQPPDLPEEPAPEQTGEPVAYTTMKQEGLVEDTVGYTFDIPTFDLPGAEAIGTHYENLADHLTDYTKEAVYGEATRRGCIASVYGEVVSATGEGGVLTVEYVFRCDYSDTQEHEETFRTDLFDVVSGERLEN